MEKIPVGGRAPGNYDADAVSDETGLDCSGDKGRTVQSQAKDADINTIVARFGLTGELPVHERRPLVIEDDMADLIGVLDYRQCLEIVKQAQGAFDDLPVAVRNRFQNNPADLMDFLSLESNRAEAVSLGIISAPAPQAPASPAPSPGAPASPGAPS